MVDGILILLMLVFAISGYRQGFVIGALSFGGFFSGVLIGLQVGPLIANQFTDDTVRLVVSLVSIFALAVLGQTLAGWLGTRLRRSISSAPLQRRARDRAAQIRAQPARQGLSQHRQREDHHQRDDQPDGAVGELVRDQRADLEADQHTAEEPAEGQRPDDETLPVAADGEDQHEQDQESIDHMHSLRVEVTVT